MDYLKKITERVTTWADLVVSTKRRDTIDMRNEAWRQVVFGLFFSQSVFEGVHIAVRAEKLAVFVDPVSETINANEARGQLATMPPILNAIQVAADGLEAERQALGGGFQPDPSGSEKACWTKSTNFESKWTP